MKRRTVSPLTRAKTLIAAGDLPKAIAELQQAAAASPGSDAVVVALGGAWLKAGEPDRAISIVAQIAARRGTQRQAAAKVIGAAARLKGLNRAPSDYVRHLFDQFSDDYDRAMVQDLHYSAPVILHSLAQMLLVPLDGGQDVLDLGCGTGLAGECFRPLARRMFGVDVSPRMIERARAKKIYDGLVVDDLESYLARSRRRFDLVLAADALVYFGDLSRVLRGAKARLRPGGWFLFTVEKHEAAGFELGPKRRYRHSAEYLRATAERSGFECMGILDCSPRSEAGRPVNGAAVALRCDAANSK